LGLGVLCILRRLFQNLPRGLEMAGYIPALVRKKRA
jgi:hypothetical protein